MSPSAQGMRVSATVRKQWMQNVAAVVLDTVEQLIIRGIVVNNTFGTLIVYLGIRTRHQKCHRSNPARYAV